MLWPEMGQYYLIQKDYLQAEKQIRRALEIEPDHYSGKFLSADALHAHWETQVQAAQSSRFDDLKKTPGGQGCRFLRIVEVRPLEVP